MGILFSNLLSESIFDFGKWSYRKYTNKQILENLFQKHIWKENAHVSNLNVSF